MMKQHRLTMKAIWIFYIIFMSGWILRVYWIDIQSMNEYIQTEINVLIKIIWWLGFSLFCMNRYNDNLNINFKEMVTNKVNLKILIPLVLVVVIYHVIGIIVLHNGLPQIELPMYDLIITVLTVGIFEESVFRGWFLNAFSHFMSERSANILSSILFLSVHFPEWIHKGMGVYSIIDTALGVILLSLIFGWIFRKNRSIWSPIIVHSLWDLGEFLM